MAQHNFEKVKDGTNIDKLAVAEKALQAAQFNLHAAQNAIHDLDLRSPIDGTVANVNVKLGEHVSAGKPVVQVGDLSHWIVQTSNLTEIQVVKIDVGQPASVVADALPGVELQGVVESISNYYAELNNDIIYTVKVALTKPDPRLRWGMTVVATFPSQ
jgi:multidrug resistance efflux pump